ncbi:aspartate racemase [Thermodesulfatator indicus DSM 15286]|uniref:Aspartate racemase n=1 Tax=Thermodesulfatator indicus (strain DSM 15286 / JCM 11887 / CIR29812) TaxID=667014 RepID=F8AAD0_THEID|nr:aspartate/glutamate racemase family protein [Thermodesulfatator indicus]AEH44268.1 aspartate racemase [Thermodesulfatator indicus DSM 15286]
MKTIGILGGMSWKSTLEYYRLINEEIKSRLGGFHSAKILLYSFDFSEIEHLQHQGSWQKLGEILKDKAQKLEQAGADFLLIATNTMHKVAPMIEKTISIPLLHIADATADAIKKQGHQRVGLLGTEFTMEEDFYCGRLKKKHQIDVLIPPKEKRRLIHKIIFHELIGGNINEESRQKFIEIIEDLKANGAQGIILGCTEIPLLIKPEHSPLPVYDTTAIHARSAVDMALAQTSGVTKWN